MKENTFIAFRRNNPHPYTFPCPFTREQIPWNLAQKYRLVNNLQGNQAADLRQLPILPLQDYAAQQDIGDFENFRDNDIVFRWQTANGHYHVMKENTFIAFRRNNPHPYTFSCPFTRERIPWNLVQQYRLVNNLQNQGNQDHVRARQSIYEDRIRRNEQQNRQRMEQQNRQANPPQNEQGDSKTKQMPTWALILILMVAGCIFSIFVIAFNRHRKRQQEKVKCGEYYPDRPLADNDANQEPLPATESSIADVYEEPELRRRTSSKTF